MTCDKSEKVRECVGERVGELERRHGNGENQWQRWEVAASDQEIGKRTTENRETRGRWTLRGNQRQSVMMIILSNDIVSVFEMDYNYQMVIFMHTRRGRRVRSRGEKKKRRRHSR